MNKNFFQEKGIPFILPGTFIVLLSALFSINFSDSVRIVRLSHLTTMIGVCLVIAGLFIILFSPAKKPSGETEALKKVEPTAEDITDTKAQEKHTYR